MRYTGVAMIAFVLIGCTPEVGSDEWCAAMKEKPRGDWTANELRDFTKHCIFK
ncbi:MAG: DUF3012 domain-containing protein [Thioalkalispiraceae bacterium]|jgi:hypothetical protein